MKKKIPVQSGKTDLSTSMDGMGHLVFKIPALNFINVWKPWLEDNDSLKELAHEMGGPPAKDILRLNFSVINDTYFGQGIEIIVHESVPFLRKCKNCGLILEVEK